MHGPLTAALRKCSFEVFIFTALQPIKQSFLNMPYWNSIVRSAILILPFFTIQCCFLVKIHCNLCQYTI